MGAPVLIAASGVGIAGMRRGKPCAVHLHAVFRNGPHHVAGVGVERVVQDLLRPAQLHLLGGIEHADLPADFSRKEQIVGDTEQRLLLQAVERLRDQGHPLLIQAFGGLVGQDNPGAGGDAHQSTNLLRDFINFTSGRIVLLLVSIFINWWFIDQHPDILMNLFGLSKNNMVASLNLVVQVLIIVINYLYSKFFVFKEDKKIND